MTDDYNQSCRSVKRKKISDAYNQGCYDRLVFRNDRLESLMKQHGFGQSAFARAVGVSQATIWKLLNEPSQGSKHLHKIAHLLGTTAAFLMGDTDDPSAGALPVPTPENLAEQLNIVQVREIDLNLGMGATYLDVPVTEMIRSFDRDWLRAYTNSAPENLLFAQGIGDSMEPTIRDSDLLFIDCSQQSITVASKFWFIAYANCGSIRRLEPLADGGVEMLADNPLAPNRTAYDGEMHVLGRVVAIVRKM
ncbi:LexA family transcriptional regulator [Novosphingobium rosa]|uniref:LexA family transcriptional regulator n=1 Tax=Novosphingobium rosa TaxID=76978 RepID=UPI000AF55F2E|nr:LexA family transcriptional regulator [Novosphingobium rosa]